MTYIPEHFAETDPAEIAAILEGAPLACIVGQTEVAGLVANHVPLLAGPDGQLIGHVAQANDMHRVLQDGQEVLVIFRGLDGYVSPNYYPTKAEHHRHVPTWNYQVVHMRGTIRFQHEVARKRAAVGLLTRLHERRVNGDAAWRMADAPDDYMAAMLEAIVALRIDVTQVLAKSKLSQNREAVDFAGAVDGVRAAGHVALADRMARDR
ncbi:FMN-binding negative transcriptional regulator [Meridianimarinicoccus aquatilis]|uniref:FMN-binding negative transcriptional regulator n=1 Tax=Meridianimarinicoccus aquatilis TaxID=2552766 RepID=A0A4R6AVU2_9RHOB|nr:FMN-binding negative transcriptional regulator [Fluviibacterium aquatile]TDL87842.1 FMN-binding negative transcriptional regulator [Fluviibacterium aquatile]